MERDLHDLLSAWLNHELEPSRCQELLDRLRRDETFRRAFAEELWMLGKLKVIQSSEPRWLKLLETLGCPPPDGNTHDRDILEQEIMRQLQLNQEEQEAKQDDSVKKLNSRSAKFQSNRFPFPAFGYIAAGILLVVSVAILWWQRDHFSQPSRQSDSTLVFTGNQSNINERIKPATVSRVISLKNAVFANQSFALGELVAPGHIELIKGWAVFEMDNGANVTLAGPAAMELVDQHTVRMINGKLIGYVPETTASFKVLTPCLDVVDLGTRFGVEVESSASANSTKVAVLEGLVQITDRSGKEHLLSESSAVQSSVDPASSLEPIAFDHDHFTMPEFDELPQNLKYLRFGFEDTSMQQLSDTGNGLLGGPFNAVSMVPDNLWTQTEGPFGQAIGFSGSQKCWFQTDFPGISGNQPRTVALWVKIARKDNYVKTTQWNRGDILPLVSWGIPRQSQKWQVVLDADRVHGKTVLRTEFEGGNVIGIRNIADGRWHHVVSVYLGGNQGSVIQRIRHYIDGQLDDVSYVREGVIDTQTDHPESHSLCLGRHLNWDFFHSVGLMDEVYVLDQALTPSQIRELYLNNRPVLNSEN